MKDPRKYTPYIGKITEVNNTHDPLMDIVTEKHPATVEIPVYGTVHIDLDGLDVLTHGYNNFEDFIGREAIIRVSQNKAFFCGVLGSGTEVNDLDGVIILQS